METGLLSARAAAENVLNNNNKPTVDNNKPLADQNKREARNRPQTPSCLSNALDYENNNNNNEGWTKVTYRKPQSARFQGKQGKAPVVLSSKFKAAEKKTSLYIYNVAKDTSESDITDYIQEKAQIAVHLQKMVKRNINKDYNSFKITVPNHLLPTFESDDFWPEGIYFRRYIVFKNRFTQD